MESGSVLCCFSPILLFIKNFNHILLLHTKKDHNFIDFASCSSLPSPSSPLCSVSSSFFSFSGVCPPFGRLLSGQTFNIPVHYLLSLVAVSDRPLIVVTLPPASPSRLNRPPVPLQFNCLSTQPFDKPLRRTSKLVLACLQFFGPATLLSFSSLSSLWFVAWAGGSFSFSPSFSLLQTSRETDVRY
ncbi:hypothetical protein BJX99DRAFT_6148 [Aspergillus californicus]